MKNLVSASLLACDKNHLLEDLKRLSESKVNLIHFDVMDGKFVNNVSFNDDSFSKIRNLTSIPFEIHLMVDNPLTYLDKYQFSNRDVIIIHYESFKNPSEIVSCLKEIKKSHRVGISIKPNTDIRVIDEFLKDLDYVLVMSVEPGFGGQKFLESALEKIKYLAKKKSDYNFVIEVDGGIDEITGKKCIEAGADILVSGSYLFQNIEERVEKLKCEK